MGRVGVLDCLAAETTAPQLFFQTFPGVAVSIGTDHSSCRPGVVSYLLADPPVPVVPVVPLVLAVRVVQTTAMEHDIGTPKPDKPEPKMAMG